MGKKVEQILAPELSLLTIADPSLSSVIIAENFKVDESSYKDFTSALSLLDQADEASHDLAAAHLLRIIDANSDLKDHARLYLGNYHANKTPADFAEALKVYSEIPVTSSVYYLARYNIGLLHEQGDGNQFLPHPVRALANYMLAFYINPNLNESGNGANASHVSVR